jgi:hypothetical protein
LLLGGGKYWHDPSLKSPLAADSRRFAPIIRYNGGE